jgi:DNA polymerase III subunit delta
MEWNVAQLERQLSQTSNTRCFLIHGEETLLVEESRDVLRQHFANIGFGDLNRLTVEAGFDWSSFSQSNHTMSLFAERRYVELRIPSGKPGDKGATLIAEFAQAASPDTVLVVICGKLDKKALANKWCGAIREAGVVVDTGSVSSSRLPGWVQSRLKQHGIDAELDVASRLAWYVEGNLLAADQEIRKLALVHPTGQSLDVETLDGVMADQSRFSVFTLSDACLAGKTKRCLRILQNLKKEGVEPILVLWALTREVRTLGMIAAEVKLGQAMSESFKRHRVWSSRTQMVSAALKRLSTDFLQIALQRLAILDRVIKGQQKLDDGPGDVWVEFERLVLGLCGINLYSADCR